LILDLSMVTMLIRVVALVFEYRKIPKYPEDISHLAYVLFAPPAPPPSPTSPSPPGSLNTTISPELKAKMCDPNNPKIAFVNSTESEVCGLPKSIRNYTTTISPITPPSSPRLITPDEASELP
jgi:hypothetical protein